MAFCNVACDREPKPAVALVLIARMVKPVERPKDVVALPFRNAGPVVIDLDANPLPFRRHANDDVFAEARSIRHEICDGALQSLTLQRQNDIALTLADLEIDRAGVDRCVVDDLLQELGEICGFGFFAAVALGEGQ